MAMTGMERVLGASLRPLALISSRWRTMSAVGAALCPLTPESQDRIKNPEAVAQPPHSIKRSAYNWR